MGIWLGIDFGTQGCRAVGIREGSSEPAASVTVPSITCLDERGVHVGAAAQKRGSFSPAGTVAGIKRLLGRKFQGPAIQWLSAVSPNRLVAAPNGDTSIRIGDVDHSPPELAAYLLESVRSSIEQELDDSVRGAVISVPVSFSEIQRHAIAAAARLADLPLVKIVHTPAAVMLGQQMRRPHLGRVVVADLGAGHFDFGIFECDDRIRAIAYAGDGLLGGQDFDIRLVAKMAGDHFARTSVDLLGRPGAVARLLLTAERCKKALSRGESSGVIDIPYLADGDEGPIHFRHEGLSRTEFDSLTQTEVAALVEPIRWCMSDASVTASSLDDVILVGGGSQIPAVRQQIGDAVGRRLDAPTTEHHLAAEGAAHLAAGDGKDMLYGVADALSRSIGIKVRGGNFRPILRRSTPTPGDVQRTLRISSGQRRVVLELFQGDSELVRDNLYLGRTVLDLPSNAEELAVTFSTDAYGVLGVSARIGRDGEALSCKYLRAGGLSVDAIDRLRGARTKRPPPVSDELARMSDPFGPVSSSTDSSGSDSTSVPAPADEVTAGLLDAPGLSPNLGPPGAAPNAPEASRPFRRVNTMLSQVHIDVAGRTEGATVLPDRHTPYSRVARARYSLKPGPLEVAADSLVGTTLDGRYELEAVLAEGGMGRVYRARHRMLNRLFAIKVLHPELATYEKISDRFLREAQAASSIKSAHVVDIHDFGRTSDGTGYFAMEYLSGRTLAQLVEDEGPQDPNFAAGLAKQIADGLQAAHAVGIVHRDLKPANIFLEQREGHQAFCKILDFGIAKSGTSDSRDPLTMVGEIMGTPHYMAPEQIDSGVVDARTDIYALGILLYELLAGRPPFDSESLAILFGMQKYQAPAALSAKVSSCPETLSDIVMTCLEKSPDDRYASASALSRALAMVYRAPEIGSSEVPPSSI